MTGDVVQHNYGRMGFRPNSRCQHFDVRRHEKQNYEAAVRHHFSSMFRVWTRTFCVILSGIGEYQSNELSWRNDNGRSSGGSTAEEESRGNVVHFHFLVERVRRVKALGDKTRLHFALSSMSIQTHGERRQWQVKCLADLAR